MPTYCLLLMTITSCFAIGATDTTLAPPIVPLFLRYISYMCVCYLLISAKWKYILSRQKFIILSLVIFLVISYIHVYGNYKVQSILLNAVIIMAFAISDDEYKAYAFIGFRAIMVIVSCLGIISYLSYIIGIPLPYTYTDFYEENSNGMYVNYYYSYLLIDRDDTVLRLCGLCNEPGLFGTINALLLTAGGFDLRKRSNILLAVSGAMCFSFAFYVLVIVGFLLSFRKRIKVILGLVLISLLFIYIISCINFENEYIIHFLSRFQFNDLTSLGGASRNSDELDRYFANSWNDIGNILIGQGSGFMPRGGVSYKIYLVRYGIIGFILIYGSVFLSAIKYAQKNWQAIVLTICFFLSVFQRPHIFSIFYFVILFGGIVYISKNNTIKERYL